MEVELIADGKKKKFKSKKITFRTFRRGTELLKAFSNDEFLGNNYSMEELDEAVDLVLDYFNHQFTKEEFYDGFQVEDALDFLSFFGEVLANIQMNNGKRELLENAGKRAAQTKE